MNVDERMITFINSFDKANSDFLEELEQEAKRDCVPIIRKDMQNLLRFLLRLKQPVKILEVGTAIGFSAKYDISIKNTPFCIFTNSVYRKHENIPISAFA